MTAPNGNGLDVHLREGGPGVSIRGSLVVLVVVILAVGGTLGYLMDLNRRSADGAAGATHALLQEHKKALDASIRDMMGQHAALVASEDRLGCIVALTPEERVRFRNTWAPGAYARWCPWLVDKP